MSRRLVQKYLVSQKQNSSKFMISRLIRNESQIIRLIPFRLSLPSFDAGPTNFDWYIPKWFSTETDSPNSIKLVEYNSLFNTKFNECIGIWSLRYTEISSNPLFENFRDWFNKFFWRNIWHIMYRFEWYYTLPVNMIMIGQWSCICLWIKIMEILP